MPVLLQLNQIRKAYGAQDVLSGASASFASDQKIGVIGRNGCGKSTLCRIITGHEEADTGTITANSELRLSYLKQHDDFRPGETTLDFLMRTTGAEHWQCGMMAAQFQLKNEMLETPILGLPGGYQTRVKLTAMLLGDPNFLILDEPSNYLDLSTLILLENFLLSFKGGYLVVSHDREFLKRTCDHTLEVNNGQTTLYPGDIEEYFEFKEEKLQQMQAFNRGVEKKRTELQAFVDRFRAKASTASRAQSKLKQLHKLKTIEIAHESSRVRIQIPRVERKVGPGLFCDNLAIGYPEKNVAKGINFDIERGDHVAILGDNGEGKTTFLRTIAGDIEARGGSFRWASGLQCAYYAQHVFSTLNPDDTVYAHLLRESANEVTNQEILNMAGCFLFQGDEVKKKVHVLSGGERARLVLAGLLLSRNQVLLLDEPTNHLDFETVEALAHALQDFGGTVFFISHDRTFVNLVATKILEVKNGKIVRYPGKYEDYVDHLENIARGEYVEAPKPETSRPKRPAEPVASETPAPSSAKETRALKSRLKKEIGALKKVMAKTERRIEHLTGERDGLLAQIRENPFHYSKDRNKRLKEIQVILEDSEEEWCQTHDKVDKLESELNRA